MDSEEFQESAKITTDFIVNYFNSLAEKNVVSTVRPGFLSGILEENCPDEGVEFSSIFREFQQKIMPGLTHWASPHFHGYFPAGNCYASMLGEFMCAALNSVSINWEACPAATDLEVLVLDWIGKMMDLPEEFLNCSKGPGGGVLQGTSTESAFLSLVAARKLAVKRAKTQRPDLTECEILDRLCIYASNQSHSFVERIGLISSMKTRLLPYDQEGKLRTHTFQTAIEDDLAQDLIPCFLVATVGSTPTCSSDNLLELGPICKQHDIWVHVDAAYAGAALVCPELREQVCPGLDYADSFAVGLHKWFLMSFDVVAMWLKNADHLIGALTIDRIYLRHKNEGLSPDYMHWQMGTGRKFKALKIWMVLMNFGANGMREHIRRHVRLGKHFESLLKQDDRFQLVTSTLGLVAFHLKVGNRETEELRNRLLDKGRIYLTPCHFHGKYLIRFVVNYSTRMEDVDFAWQEIRKTTDELERVDFNKKDEMMANDIKKIFYLDDGQNCEFRKEIK